MAVSYIIKTRDVLDHPNKSHSMKGGHELMYVLIARVRTVLTKDQRSSNHRKARIK